MLVDVYLHLKNITKEEINKYKFVSFLITSIFYQSPDLFHQSVVHTFLFHPILKSRILLYSQHMQIRNIITLFYFQLYTVKKNILKCLVVKCNFTKQVQKIKIFLFFFISIYLGFTWHLETTMENHFQEQKGLISIIFLQLISNTLIKQVHVL